MERARHSDERIQQVGPVARAVWDYVCCNLQDHPSGLYRLSVALACEDTGWELERFEEALDELERVKLLARDKPVRLVWVCNMLRKSYPGGGKWMNDNQLRGITRHLESMPKTHLVASFVSYYANRYGLGIPCATLEEPMSEGSAGVLGNPPIGTVRIGLGTEGSGTEGEPPFVGAPANATPPGLGQFLAEALAWGHDGVSPPVPPWGDTGRTQRRRQLSAAWEPAAALVEQVAVECGGPSDAVKQILGDLERWARLADDGKLDAGGWGGGKLLTPNGYRRLVNEIENAAKRKGTSGPVSDEDDAESRRQAGEELKKLNAEADAREAEEKNQ